MDNSSQKGKRSLIIDTVIRIIKEKPLGTVGGIIVLFMFITGIAADLIAPYGVNEINLLHVLKPPDSQFILGTDNLGRDMLSRIIYGARISMIVGLAGAGLDILVCVAIGSLSGFIGGKFDVVVQRFVDAWMCFPYLFIVLTIMSLLGPGMVQVIFVMGLSAGIRSSRVIRSAVMAMKEEVYVEAATSIGASTFKIIIRHILPNIMAPIIVVFTLSLAGMIITEATISFLGFGIPPPIPSWGGMLSGSGRSFMHIAPWLAIWPGLALSIAVYGINMLGDALRDVLDPRLRGGIGRYNGTKLVKKAGIFARLRHRKAE